MNVGMISHSCKLHYGRQVFEYLSLQVLASVDMSVTLWPKQLGIWAPYVHHCKNEALMGSVLALCVTMKRP